MLFKNIYKWVLIDAEKQNWGRLSSQIVYLLTSDFIYTTKVVVLNLSKLKISHNKKENKYFFNHTGYPGGGNKIYLKNIMEHKTLLRIFLKTTKNMMQKEHRLSLKKLNNLYLYLDDYHPHSGHNFSLLKRVT